MDYSEITINHLFEKQLIPLNNVGGIIGQEKIRQMEEEALNKERRIKWKKLIGKALVRSPELLNIRLKDILEGAWKKYQTIMDYLDKEKYPPDETFLIPLLEHTVTSVHHPKIEVLVHDVAIGTVDFELLLNLKLKGIIVRIKNGEIEGVKTGSCSASGSFSCEGIKIFEETTKEFDFQPG